MSDIGLCEVLVIVYMDVACGINYTLFYQLHIGEVCSVLGLLGW